MGRSLRLLQILYLCFQIRLTRRIVETGSVFFLISYQFLLELGWGG